VPAPPRHDPAPDGKPSTSPAATHSIARRTLLQASIVIGLVAFAIFIWYSLQVLFLLFAGVLLAILLRGLADLLSENCGIGPKTSLAIVIIVLAVVIVGGGWIFADKLIAQLSQLVDQLPHTIETLKLRLNQTSWGRLALRTMPSGQNGQAWATQFFGSVPWFFSSAASAIVTTFVILVIGLYMAAEPRMYIRGALWLIPRDRRDRVAEVMGAVGYTLKWWLIGQSIDMLIIGSATAIAMWIIGVPLALLIGFITGIFNFIPNFGPLFGLTPAVLLALSDSPEKALWVILAFIVLQSIEGYLLLPMILRRAVDVPAAIGIATQVLLSLLAGGLGLALAAPLAAATLVIVKMLYVEDVLHEHIDTPEQGPAQEEIREVKEVKEQVDREASQPH